MKKSILILLICVFMACSVFIGCSNKNNGPDESQTDYLSSSSASFEIIADKPVLNSITDKLLVTVKMTANEANTITLGTSSYGKEGAIWIECFAVIGGIEYTMPDNTYGINVVHMELSFNLVQGESLTRTLEFSRSTNYPLNNGKEVPPGEYKIRVCAVWMNEWLTSEIIITAD